MSLLASTVAAERDGETADDEAGHVGLVAIASTNL
jgi:hypothetical protein